MLVVKQKRNTFYLVPECCQMTGVTEEQLRNFQLAREVCSIREPDFSTKLIDIKRYFFDII